MKKLSQKQVRADSSISQGQYSRIENGKVEPSISTLEKLAALFEVGIAAFFKSDDLDREVNLPLMQKIKLIDTPAADEQQALLEMIDLALANKRMKDNLQSIIELNKKSHPFPNGFSIKGQGILFLPHRNRYPAVLGSAFFGIVRCYRMLLSESFRS